MTENTKYYLGSFAISFGRPNLTADGDFNSFIIDKYKRLANKNESYYTDAFFETKLSCNRPESFFNFNEPYKQCPVDVNDKINNVLKDFKKTDASRFNYVNSVLSLLASYGKYINNNCSTIENKTEFMACVFAGSTSTVLKPYLKNIVLDEDSLHKKNVRIFDNVTCNGYNLPYTIYHIYGSISSPKLTE